MLHQNNTFLSRFESLVSRLGQQLSSSRVLFGVSLVMGGLGVLGMCAGIFFLFQSSREGVADVAEVEQSLSLPQEILPSNSPLPEKPADLMAEISGAVKKPGVYLLPHTARVSDLIAQAGGFTSAVDQDHVDRELHLTEKLSDGFKLFIPSRGQMGDSAPLSVPSLEKLNVNQASAAELTLLPGIGDKRVQKILDERPFASLEEFSQKTGISGKSLKEIEQFIVF